MSAGTLTLTNNSAAVSGAGTAFNTELAAGDFIVVTVGGVPYTLPVISVESSTALTLVSAYTGPTQSGAAWSAVPRVALNMVTAALVAQSAEALRGLNYDKQNWQQVFSGTGTITVRLPDGTTYTGPAWNGISTALDNKASKGPNSDITSLRGLTTALSISQGGTGEKNAAGARKSLGALSNTPSSTGSGGDGDRIQHANGAGLFNLDMFNCYWYMQPDDTNFWIAQSVSYAGNGGSASGYGRIMYAIKIADGTVKYVQCLTSKNTTIDTNGFVKNASPIVNIFGDGRFTTNDESDGVTVKKVGVGEYIVDGCIGLNADAKWGGTDGGFEVPTDRNKQPRIWLDYKVNPDGSIVVKTFHRTHTQAPAFAQNILEDVNDGDPVDIPADSFVSVRVEMPKTASGIRSGLTRSMR